MSNKEIYAVKSSEGKYLNLFGNWIENLDYATFFAKKAQAKFYADRFNGQAIAIVEEPKKVVLTKEQAKVIKEAHDAAWPAKYITDHCDNSNGLEELLMNAYTNGYTVAKKKYRVLLPESWCRSEDKQKYFLFDTHIGISWTEDRNDPKTMFTKEQLGTLGLDRAYFKKDEVTDDDN